MRGVPPALQDRLESGATTLCRCWLITRRDGRVQGFTDHDETVLLEGTPCLADAGLSASEATDRLGMQIDGAELSGALMHDSLTEADLAAGRYDAASIETWLVDWSEPDLHVLLGKGVLGEVRREGAAFTAEVRSLADRLNQESGLLYTAACTADLGDARCKMDLAQSTYRGVGTVTALSSASTLAVSGLDSFADGWFTAGRLVFSGGANAGTAFEVKLHRAELSGVTLSLWQAAPEPIVPGDAFTVTAGCDKLFATCRDRFANATNFRGFPHIPGNDFVIGYPSPGKPGNDGRRFSIVSMIGKANVLGSNDPSSPAFWFIMSMALLVGLCAAYPMNYWLVAKKLKHGMTTVRPKTPTPAMAGMAGEAAAAGMAPMPGMETVPNSTIALVAALSFLVLIIGVAIGLSFA